MGTTAIIWSKDPRAGGRALAQIGGDGHPEHFKRLAKATSQRSWCDIVTRMLARVEHLRPVKPASWWFPAHNGLFVHDYAYWWDGATDRPTMAHYQFGPVEMSKRNRDGDSFPDDANPALRGLPVPEHLITVDPFLEIPNSAHRRSWTFIDELECAVSPERLFAAVPTGDMVIERRPGGIYMVVIDGGICGEGETLTKAIALSLSDGRVGPLPANDPPPFKFGVPFLYSVEDLLHESYRGRMCVRRSESGRWHVELNHPVYGRFRAQSNVLARALVRIRRHLLSSDGFKLERTPPFA